MVITGTREKHLSTTELRNKRFLHEMQQNSFGTLNNHNCAASRDEFSDM